MILTFLRRCRMSSGCLRPTLFGWGHEIAPSASGSTDEMHHLIMMHSLEVVQPGESRCAHVLVEG